MAFSEETDFNGLYHSVVVRYMSNNPDRIGVFNRIAMQSGENLLAGWVRQDDGLCHQFVSMTYTCGTQHVLQRNVMDGRGEQTIVFGGPVKEKINYYSASYNKFSRLRHRAVGFPDGLIETDRGADRSYFDGFAVQHLNLSQTPVEHITLPDQSSLSGQFAADGLVLCNSYQNGKMTELYVSNKGELEFTSTSKHGMPRSERHQLCTNGLI